MSPDTVTLPDTNTILRYLLKDHPELSVHTAEYWESVREGHTAALMTEGVLMECVYVLPRFYKVPREKIARGLLCLACVRCLELGGPGPPDPAGVLYGRAEDGRILHILFDSPRSPQRERRVEGTDPCRMGGLAHAAGVTPKKCRSGLSG